VPGLRGECLYHMLETNAIVKEPATPPEPGILRHGGGFA